MATPEKERIVAEVSDKMSQAKSVFLADFTGLNVQEASDLRRAFREAAVEYRVVKNTLARLSVKAVGHDGLLEYFQGPTAIAFGMGDPAAPAKVLKKFEKQTDKVKVKACLFEGTMIGSDKLSDLASLPSRDEVLGQLVSVLNAPISNLAFALNGVTSKLAYALDAVRKQKEENS